MFQTTPRIAAGAIIALSCLGSAVNAATTSGVAPGLCRTATATVLRRALPTEVSGTTNSTFAVVRVTLAPNGAIVSRALRWNSGDASFNRASLRAIERTAFAPASRACAATASTFDYIFTSSARGSRVTAVLLPKLGE